MSDYTPTTERVRTEYAKAAPRILRPAFDRWLADHDREVAAQALEDAADHWSEWETFVASDGVTSIRKHGKEPDEWLRERAAEYRVADQNGGE